MRGLRISVYLIVSVLLCIPAVRAAEPSPDAVALSRGNTAFALDLYGQLRKQNGNIFFSPLSISAVLGMTYGGAGGATASQMEKALHFPVKGEKIHQAFAALTHELVGKEAGKPDTAEAGKSDTAEAGKSDTEEAGKLDAKESSEKTVEFNIANSMWMQQGEALRDSYLEAIKAHYGPSVFPVDFIKDELSVRTRINNWVEKATRDKITNIVSSPLDPATRLLLVNAVYFKGAWETPFMKELTKKGDFFTAEGKVRVPFMHQDGSFNYYWEKGLQVLELPYADNRTTMLILLPNKGSKTLEKLEKSLSPKRLATWRSKLRNSMVNVFLPRFSITWGAEPLSKHLAALGMRDAFSKNADFSGIISGEPLFISDVVHKAFVDVTEEGTEAAAATMLLATGAGGTNFLQPFIFRADRPFLFLLLDNPTGSILFMGRVAKPEEKG